MIPERLTWTECGKASDLNFACKKPLWCTLARQVHCLAGIWDVFFPIRQVRVCAVLEITLMQGLDELQNVRTPSKLAKNPEYRLHLLRRLIKHELFLRKIAAHD